jgi:hypothetical protein
LNPLQDFAQQWETGVFAHKIGSSRFEIMKLALAASFVASAAAFAPASQGKVSTALSMGYENSLGAIAPVGFFGTCHGQPDILLLAASLVLMPFRVS